MDTVTIRLATPQDGAAIADIYRPYVEQTSISFETVAPTGEQMGERIAHITSVYPYLVCTIDNEVAGYAYAHRHMDRAAYDWNVELSVYVGGGYQRRGIGRALYEALLQILMKMGVLNVYGLVTIPNPKSQALHSALGFSEVGVMRQTGYKQGRWRNVAYYEKSLGLHDQKPEPIAPISQMDPRLLEEIFMLYGRLIRT